MRDVDAELKWESLFLVFASVYIYWQTWKCRLGKLVSAGSYSVLRNFKEYAVIYGVGFTSGHAST